MTEFEKYKVLEFREKGMGYTKISNELNISVNTIKSFCRRHSKTKLEENVHYCKCCGRGVEQTKGRKEKKFCSIECRRKWWNSHLDLVNRKAYRHRKCIKCGKDFVVYGSSKKKYCSHNCYIAQREKGVIGAFAK